MLLLGRPDVSGLRTNKNVKGLVKALGWRKDRHVRRAAATALGQLGDPRAVNPLIRALNDSDSGVRGAAATALGQLGDTRAVNPLITVIQNDEWSVREAAVAALGNIGAHAVGPLIAALHDQDEYVRRAAAGALGQIGDPRAVKALISALDDESAAARQAAAEALGQIGDPDAVEPLIGALNDQNANVRKAAAAALDGLAWSPDRGATGAAYWVAKEQWKKCVKIAAIEPLIAVLHDDRVIEIRDAPATRTLVKIGARAVGPLIGSLNDQNGNVRQAAAEALGQIGDPRAVEPLIGVLKDENEKVRRATAEALSRIRDPLAVEPLIGVLKDNDRLVREDAVRALGQIGDPRAVEPLIAALHDHEEYVRADAARALGKIGDPHAVEPLIGAFNDQNANVRMAAAAALDGLAWSPDTSAAGAAYWVAKQQWEKCVQIAAVEPLIAGLQDQISSVREHAAWALGKIGDPRTVEPLIAALHGLPRSLDVQRAAASSLVSLYSSGMLDEGRKARVLAQRAFITYQDHVPEHEGVDSRDDETIGVDFPL